MRISEFRSFGLSVFALLLFAVVIAQTTTGDGVAEVNQLNPHPAVGTQEAATPLPDFVPTHEWQTILPGQAIPPGLEVSIDMSTGERKARLSDFKRDSGPPRGALVHQPLVLTDADKADVQDEMVAATAVAAAARSTSDQASVPVTPSSLLTSMIQLSTASASSSGDSEEEPFIPKHTPEELRELGEYLESRMAPPDAKIMKDRLEKLNISAEVDLPVADALSALSMLEDLAHQTDNAQDFLTIGGLPIALRYLAGRRTSPLYAPMLLTEQDRVEQQRAAEHEHGYFPIPGAHEKMITDDVLTSLDMQAVTAMLFGTLTQNQPVVQQRIMEKAPYVIEYLIALLDSATQLARRSVTDATPQVLKAVYEWERLESLQHHLMRVRRHREIYEEKRQAALANGEPEPPVPPFYVRPRNPHETKIPGDLVTQARGRAYDVQTRILYALSALTRSNAQAQDRLFAAQGLERIFDILTRSLSTEESFRHPSTPQSNESSQQAEQQADDKPPILASHLELRLKRKAISLVNDFFADLTVNSVDSSNSSSQTLALALSSPEACRSIASVFLPRPTDLSQPHLDNDVRDSMLRILQVWQDRSLCREQLNSPEVHNVLQSLWQEWDQAFQQDQTNEYVSSLRDRVYALLHPSAKST